MHLFSPERPKLGNGQPKLLNNNSAVPRLLAEPLPNGSIRLSLMLNNYDSHGGYSWRSVEVLRNSLPEFFTAFSVDPELTLLDYFGWQPQVSTKAIPIQLGPAPTYDMSELL